MSFSEKSIWDKTNPWFYQRHIIQVPFVPQAYDYLFLAGMDWQPYLMGGVDSEKPVINLIQHVRHADSSQDVHQFLKQKAVRICVSPEVTDAIKSQANGPVFTIPNGHHTPIKTTRKKQWDYLIVGGKRPDWARKLASQLNDGLTQGSDKSQVEVCLLDQFVPRIELLEKMASSRVVVVLPNETEGFYLPALEAMQLADVAVVPDCVGNRSFCEDTINCLFPAYDLGAITSAARQALLLLGDSTKIHAIKLAAQETLRNHSLKQERKRFLDIMNNLDQLW